MERQPPPDLVDSIVHRLQPVEVYLFGSHARGDARPDSDLDLYVVVDDLGAEEKRTGAARSEARGGYAGALDLVIGTKSAFDLRRHQIGSLEEIVSHEGLRVYSRG